MLRVLQYPKAEGFRLDDPQQFRSLVNWIEAHKIRSGKGTNLKDTYASNWDEEYKIYLKDLQCPVEWYEEGTQTTFAKNTASWLTGHAVKMQYSEKAVEIALRTQQVLAFETGIFNLTC